jgi:hypothetical protein
MFAATGCRQAVAGESVCESVVAYAKSLMKSRHVMAVTVVQQVSTGAVVLFASSEPDKLDVSTPVLPLSLSNVFIAASWWDHNLPDREFESVHGVGNAAKRVHSSLNLSPVRGRQTAGSPVPPQGGYTGRVKQTAAQNYAPIAPAFPGVRLMFSVI